MNHQQLEIKNRKGNTLHAVLELPSDQHPRAYAIFAHCFTCSSSFAAPRNISRALTNEGFAVIRFDFTGLGKSEGEFAESKFSANVNDLLDVHAHIKERFEAPVLLIGHSLGGAAVLVAANQLDDVKAVATIGAPASVEHVKKHIKKVEEASDGQDRFKVDIGGRPFEIDNEFLDDLEKVSLPEEVEKLRRPLLIMHAPFDKTVAVSNARKLYEAAMHPKSFISLDGADHLITDQRDSKYIGDIIGSWVKRYFNAEEKEELKLGDEQVVARLNLLEDNFTTEIKTKNHGLIADEPSDVGGDDFGPSPYELLNAALGACTVMTLKLYAERKKWPLEEARVYLTHSKKHMDDMQSEEDKKADHISKRITLEGDLDESQKKRLMEIAEKCPVNRTLQQGVKIEGSLEDHG